MVLLIPLLIPLLMLLLVAAVPPAKLSLPALCVEGAAAPMRALAPASGKGAALGWGPRAATEYAAPPDTASEAGGCFCCGGCWNRRPREPAPLLLLRGGDSVCTTSPPAASTHTSSTLTEPPGPTLRRVPLCSSTEGRSAPSCRRRSCVGGSRPASRQSTEEATSACTSHLQTVERASGARSGAHIQRKHAGTLRTQRPITYLPLPPIR
jgi:hypothetical protein